MTSNYNPSFSYNSIKTRIREMHIHMHTLFVSVYSTKKLVHAYIYTYLYRTSTQRYRILNYNNRG
ncbi:hypothetical protein BD770DRAFT_385438, partial [Pilaira anomala]